ncbi:MAG: hypothetical protein GXO26_09145 [Crenarchaeota archaeon]|nr:hypothetical protein [Thermoproteota archaeon]
MNFLPLIACFDRKISRECIDKIIKELQDENIHHVIVRPEKIINYIHLQQALNICLRNRKIGIRIAKKPEIDLICYICCTDNIKNAIDECVDDLGRCILVISFTEDEDVDIQEIAKSQRTLIELIEKECKAGSIDIAYCGSCYRNVEPSRYCASDSILDVLEKLVELVLDRVE